MAFVKFKDVNRSHALKASISTTGVLSFNDGARRRFQMDEKRFCVLYYDEEAKIIGIEFTKDEHAEGAKNIRLRQTGADISAKSFLDFFEIRVEKTTLYEIVRDKDSGWAIIELSRGRERGGTSKNFDENEEENS